MKGLASFSLLTLVACGAAPPAPTSEPRTSHAEQSEPRAAAVPIVTAPPAEGWAHDEERWRIAQAATRDVANADLHQELGLGLFLSNHEFLLLCPNAAMEVRVEGSRDFYVSTSRVDDVDALIEGLPLFDAEDPTAFLCHSEWPVCTQGSRLYVFAGEHLASVDQEFDFNVASYDDAETREWILGEIELRMQLSPDACATAYAALADDFHYRRGRRCSYARPTRQP